jgi:hypothetical protein
VRKRPTNIRKRKCRRKGGRGDARGESIIWDPVFKTLTKIKLDLLYIPSLSLSLSLSLSFVLSLSLFSLFLFKKPTVSSSPPPSSHWLPTLCHALQSLGGSGGGGGGGGDGGKGHWRVNPLQFEDGSSRVSCSSFA